MKKTQVVLIDDIDGAEAAETIIFSLRGVSYEIDLSQGHVAELEADFAKWIEAGRKVSGRAPRASRQKAARSPRAGEIREWAQAKGIAVNERGRIPAEIVAQFEADRA